LFCEKIVERYARVIAVCLHPVAYRKNRLIELRIAFSERRRRGRIGMVKDAMIELRMPMSIPFQIG